MHSKNPASAALSGSTPPLIHWEEDGESRSAHWRSESGNPPPKRVVPGDDQMTADSAYRLACEGTAILWRGDFQNARQMLTALAHRADRPPRKPGKTRPAAVPKQMSPVEAFNASVSARHGSALQSRVSAAAAASLTSRRSSWLSSAGSMSP